MQTSKHATLRDGYGKTTPSRWNSRGPVLVIAVVTILTFCRCFTAEFVTWDDDTAIYGNWTLNPPTWHSMTVWWTTPNTRMWNPLTETMRGLLALASTQNIDPATATHLNPYVFHLDNVVLHTLTTCILYQVLRLLGFKNWPACAGALMFGIHPLQVEPVAWATALKDILCGVFSVSAIWALLRANGFTVVEPGVPLADEPMVNLPYLALATVLFVLAMLAKPTAVMLPLTALAFLWIGWRTLPKRIWLQIGLWVLLSLPIMIIARMVQSAQPVVDTGYWKRPLIAADALAFYLCKLVWPLTLTIDYGRRPTIIFQNGWAYWTWLAPVALAVLLVVLCKRHRTLAAGGLAFVAPLLPVLGLTTFDFQSYSTVADRYVYLSLVGAAIWCAWMAQRSGPRGRVVIIVALFLFSAKSWAQTGYWHDSVSLFTHSLAVTPNSPAALNNLSVAALVAGDAEKQLWYLQRSVAVRPDMAVSYLGLGAAEAKAGDWEAAARVYRQGFLVAPQIVGDEVVHLAAYFGKKESLDLATKYGRLAIELRPDSAMAHSNLGTNLAETGDRKGALAELKRAAELDPSKFAVQCNLATILAQNGRLDEAEAHYRIALSLQPTSPEVLSGMQHVASLRAKPKPAK